MLTIFEKRPWIFKAFYPWKAVKLLLWVVWQIFHILKLTEEINNGSHISEEFLFFFWAKLEFRKFCKVIKFLFGEVCHLFVMMNKTDLKLGIMRRKASDFFNLAGIASFLFLLQTAKTFLHSKKRKNQIFISFFHKWWTTKFLSRSRE